VKTENYYRAFIDQNPDGIFRIDFDEPIDLNAALNKQIKNFFRFGAIGEFNLSFAQIFETLSGRTLAGARLSELAADLSVLDQEVVKNFFEAGRKIENFETEQTDTSGQTRFFSNSLYGVVENEKLVGVWVKQLDITTEKIARQKSAEIEKNWLLTQKIEALGRLAGGIAHDFNNFLAVMMLQTDMLNLQLPANSPLRHRTEEMKKANQRAAAMVKQLLAVGRKQTINPQPVEINNVVREFTKALPEVVPGKIEVIIDLRPDAGLCFIDQNQMIQALVNLARNAQEAMPGGGTLKISTETIVLDKKSVRHKSQPEGWFVQVTVSDDGIGMDSTVLESVFEPFFSTKKSSKGVGLGLATVYGFVKQSKGFIWVESELSNGTSFKIQFPRIDQPMIEAE
jgi:signal transduction histidine kinase